MRKVLVSALFLFLGAPESRAEEESFKPYTDAPRLLLRSQRLRLLTRERERQSIRYQQFETYIKSGVELPEPAFMLAFASRIMKDPAHCTNAYAWLQQKAAAPEVRQRALVLDWCAETLTPAQTAKLASQIEAAIPQATTIGSLRDRAFAALALADVKVELTEKILRETVQFWRASFAPKLKTGWSVPREELYPLLELLHAVRDNIEIDLRQDAPRYFLDLPLIQMLGYYPAPYPGPDNVFRVAFFKGDGEPDLKLAAMLRAAELSMVAYDTNAELSQSLQGWLLQDRYLLRGADGIAYEFLWANPYQPGLTYHHLPNSFHDKNHGMLFIRNSWEEEARYICYYDGKIQLFEDGKRKLMKISPNTPPIEMGEATILVGAPAMLKPVQFQLAGTDRESWYIVGLKPNAIYDIEVDDEELDEARTDGGGILSLDFKRGVAKTGVRVFPAAYAVASK
jgi:hypothetical protein